MEKMKLKNLEMERIDKLFDVIDSCSGKVELVGKDIRLNLKSKLAQYFLSRRFFQMAK